MSMPVVSSVKSLILSTCHFVGDCFVSFNNLLASSLTCGLSAALPACSSTLAGGFNGAGIFRRQTVCNDTWLPDCVAAELESHTSKGSWTSLITEWLLSRSWGWISYFG